MATIHKIDVKPENRGRLTGDIDAVMARINAGEPYASIASDYGVDQSAVGHIARGRGVYRGKGWLGGKRRPRGEKPAQPRAAVDARATLAASCHFYSAIADELQTRADVAKKQADALKAALAAFDGAAA